MDVTAARIALALSTIGILVAAPARAVTLANGKLSLGGFGQSGYGRTTGNAYSVGSRDGEYASGNMALVVTAKPAEQTVIAAQAFFDVRGAAQADWVFAEWRFDDLLRGRVGKIQQPRGLFGELVDVGVARPFYSLPVSIYGASNLGAEAYYGVGAAGEVALGEAWNVAYDAYGGWMTVPMYQPFEVASGAPPYDFALVAGEKATVRELLGARLFLVTPMEHLRFGVSGFTGKHQAKTERPDEVRMIVIGLSGEYVGDRFSCRSEVFRSTEGSNETNLAGYVEAAAFVLRRVQLATRLEASQTTVSGYTGPSSLLRHREAALGLNYWPAPQLAFKLSFHEVEGNRFAVPTDEIVAASVPERTHLVVAGAQFSF